MSSKQHCFVLNSGLGQIIILNIKVKLSDGKEIIISDTVKALEDLQMLANCKPPLQPLPLKTYIMNIVTVKACSI